MAFRASRKGTSAALRRVRRVLSGGEGLSEGGTSFCSMTERSGLPGWRLGGEGCVPRVEEAREVGIFQVYSNV